MKKEKPDSYSALFLDRDGVINERIEDGYVTTWSEFSFIDGALEAIAKLATIFDRIFIVTNQQGVGKGLMSKEDLEEIHKLMIEGIERGGGRIDAIFYCPDLSTKAYNCRKPGVVMGLQARKRFPEIRFRRSFMAGDTASDMIFGGKLGMKRVFIDGGSFHANPGKYGCDLRFDSLLKFAEYIT
jgi:histidinol-phosphate phosphatase family protein